MCAESLSSVEFQALEKTLATTIDNARSLDEIDAWIKSQQCVKSVQLADYLLKSNPPQRDFIVEIRMQDGSTSKKVVNILDLGNQQYQFRKLRDQ
jgi:retron-type reverse transcriptase